MFQSVRLAPDRDFDGVTFVEQVGLAVVGERDADLAVAEPQRESELVEAMREPGVGWHGTGVSAGPALIRIGRS